MPFNYVNSLCQFSKISPFYFLEKYQKMELEKKKTRGSKKGIIGPTIRYHSVAMPLIEELPSSHGLVTDEKINVEDTNEESVLIVLFTTQLKFIHMIL